jgi:hypothetical protein
MRAQSFHATPDNVVASETVIVSTPDVKPVVCVYSAWAPRILPVVVDVRKDIVYGENGVEFTGTYAPGGGGSGMSKSRVVNDA